MSSKKNIRFPDITNYYKIFNVSSTFFILARKRETYPYTQNILMEHIPG